MPVPGAKVDELMDDLLVPKAAKVAVVNLDDLMAPGANADNLMVPEAAMVHLEDLPLPVMICW
jgi:hypothetical protein